MLRVELSPNGAFNVTEFGTVKNPEQFQAMLAYSPYHNVKDGADYPAVLFLTGANDPRVDPMQSRKMTARLQAAEPGGQFLLRTSGDSGHGLDTPLAERIAQQTDIFAFLFSELGVPVPRSGPQTHGKTAVAKLAIDVHARELQFASLQLQSFGRIRRALHNNASRNGGPDFWG